MKTKTKKLKMKLKRTTFPCHPLNLTAMILKCKFHPQFLQNALKDRVVELEKEATESIQDFVPFPKKIPPQKKKANKKAVKRSKSSPPQVKNPNSHNSRGARPIPSKYPKHTDSPKKRPQKASFIEPLSLSPSPESSSQDSFVLGHNFSHAQPPDSDIEMTPVQTPSYPRQPQNMIQSPVTPEHLIIKPRRLFHNVELKNCSSNI